MKIQNGDRIQHRDSRKNWVVVAVTPHGDVTDPCWTCRLVPEDRKGEIPFDCGFRELQTGWRV